MAQKFANIKNSDSFAAHSNIHFTQKPSPQKCRKIMNFNIFSTLNPIGPIKTWSKLSCTLCMKERMEIIDNLRLRYIRIINACSEVYGACRHIPISQRVYPALKILWYVKKSIISNFPNRPKRKMFSAGRSKFGKGEDHNPWEGIFV